MIRSICFACCILAGTAILAQADSVRLAWLQTVPKELKRVQVPQWPYHYVVEDVSFTGKETGLTYGATLTKPKNKTKFPTVVLISGTGAQDRDYTAYFHKFFWVLADELTNRGIAVLRIDDRGTGGTNGDFAASTSDDFAKDAMAAIAWLKTRNDIDSTRIGLIGHSEGGIIAPMAYVKNSSAIGFMVLIAPPIIGLRAINRFQTYQSLKDGGLPDSLIQARTRLHESIADEIVEKVHTDEELNQVIRAEVHSFCGSASPQLLDQLMIRENESTIESFNRSYRGYLTPWWQFILRYRPENDIGRIHCPVLALFGTKDRQVPPVEDYKLLKKILPANGRSEIKIIEGINHFMQPAQLGTEREYFFISTTIDPEIYKTISNWILGLYPAKEPQGLN